MKIFDGLRFAAGSIGSNKMRTLLTMFGIIVGIGSVIMITAIGAGFQQSLLTQIEKFNLDTLQIQYDAKGEYNSQEFLTARDAEDIKGYPGVTAAAPVFTLMFNESVELKNPGQTAGIYVYGTDEDYFKINRRELLHGRSLSPKDIEFSARVVIINEILADAVFGYKDVVGQKLTMKTWNGAESFTIAGVIKSNENDRYILMYNQPHSVYVPLPAAQSMTYWGSDSLDYVDVKTENFERSKDIGDNVVKILEFKKRAEGKYTFWSFSDQLAQMNNVILIFTIFLSLVAAISLFVGGIGVMNIMLVSVTERTTEIGIRKALGATNANIRLQFLMEALMITAMGGFLGLLLGWGGATLIGRVLSSSMEFELIPQISMGAVLIAIGVSSAVGIIFGVFPASKAAKMNVIDAMQFE